MKKLLDEINSSNDVKKLNIPQLKTLAKEIREFLVANVSRCGGHLSSNLGAVELTLALHKVFDFSKDKIVWDVGHQSYTHKIVTGRRDTFHTLRQKDGVSGFPKTEESPLDAFNTGHSSTSISAALGFAKAFEIQRLNNLAVAVIGDGALTGGMAYEALNHAGSGKTPLIVVLNDNGMSISENVGSVSKYLEKLRGNALYIVLKVKVKGLFNSLPILGKPIVRIFHHGKRLLKKLLLQKKLFENMGFEYIGPINGHDFKDLLTALEYAKTFQRPVIVHTITQKGKGYTPSETDPSSFHGISAFNPETGQVTAVEKTTFSDVFGDEIVNIAKKNPKVAAITAAMPQGTGLCKFAEIFPERFFDVGIAEQHAVTFAAGLSKGGLIPVFAVYSTFLQRGYDQLLHDACLQNLHAVFAIDRAGAAGNDGETHQGIYDLSYLSHLPNMSVLAPASEEELRKMLNFAVFEHKGPIAIRYPKGSAETLVPCSEEIALGKGAILKKGTDVLIVAIGSSVKDALEVAERLEGFGMAASVINARFLKPFDEELFLELSDCHKLVATIEDNCKFGGLSSAVRELYNGKILSFAFPDTPLVQGTVAEQKAAAGLDAESIANKIKDTLGDIIG